MTEQFDRNAPSNDLSDRGRRLELTPIGYIHTPFSDRYAAPRQPGVGVSAEGVITLERGLNFEQALTDLSGFERIWLLYWFDRNPNWKPMVLPPRSGTTKRGVFATRSPHRPNPIGLSVVELLEINGLTLRVQNVDLLNGTPILDIKPYVPSADAYPDSRIGWLSEAVAKGEPYNIRWSQRAREQAEWLLVRGIDLTTHANSILALDPSEHPYKRIIELGDGSRELALKSWRLFFRIVSQDEIMVERIGSGYSSSALHNSEGQTLHQSETHLEFHARWSEDL